MTRRLLTFIGSATPACNLTITVDSWTLTKSEMIKPSVGVIEQAQTSLKGKYHANLLSFQNPEMFVSRKNEMIVKFVINYHPSAIKLPISASGQRQSRSV